MRSRSVKPGFFKNEELASLPADARLLFIGLWCLADREGRLENRPQRIKAEIFPYEHDVNMVLAWCKLLTERGFIFPYKKNSNRYIQIENFHKHQYPHIREAKSTIPAPDEHHTSTIRARLTPDSGVLTPDSRIGAAAPPAPAPEPPYKRPDAKTEPLRTLVFGYKLKKGFPAEDRTWDRQVWPRASKAGKLILEAFDGNLRSALTCLESLADEYDKKGLDWTLETIEKHCLEWKLKHGGYSHGSAGGERVFNDFVKRGAKGKSERVGSFVPAREIIAGMGVVPDIPAGVGREKGLPVGGNGGAPAGLEPPKLEGQPDR